MGGKLAAFHRREPLPDGVDLHDVCPAGQELAGGVLQLTERDQGLFKEGAAAAGEKKQHRVVLPEIFRQRQGGFGGQDAVFIRHGMPCLKAAQPGDGPVKMAVFADDNPLCHWHAENGQRRRGHTGRGLTGSDEKHPARKPFSQQRTAHRALRHYGVDGRIGGFFRVEAKFTIHG